MKKVIFGLICFLLMINVSFGYTLTVNGFSRTDVNSGRKITINATEKSTKKFKMWEVVSGSLVLTSPSSRSITFTMPACNVELMAKYDTDEGSTDKYNLKIESVYFSRNEKKRVGESVTVTAITDSDKRKFVCWNAVGVSLTDVQKKSSIITFSMPSNDVELTAVYSDVDKYILKLETPYYTRFEEWKQGDSVTIEALTSDGTKTFSGWTATGVSLTTSQKSSNSLTFTMPGNFVELVANYI